MNILRKSSKKYTRFIFLAPTFVSLLLVFFVFLLSHAENVSAADYPDYIENGSYGTVKQNLRVRSGPSTSNTQIGLIKGGTVVHIHGNVTTTSDSNVWCYCEEYKGYISIKYLKDIYYAKPASKDDHEGNPISGLDLSDLSSGTYYYIMTGPGKAFDVQDFGTKNGTNLQIYEPTGNANQIFSFEIQPSGAYVIRDKNSGLVIDVKGAKVKKRTNIQVYKANGTKAQEWYIVPHDDGTVSFESALNRKYVLDVKGYADNKNNATIQLFTWNDTHNQKFKLVKVLTPAESTIIETIFGNGGSTSVLALSNINGTILDCLRNKATLQTILSNISDDAFIAVMNYMRTSSSVTEEQKKEYLELLSKPDVFIILEKRSLDVVKHRLVDGSLDGKSVHFWTVTGEPCNGTSYDNGHGCKNCDLKYIMQYVDSKSPNRCEWYTELFPEFEVYGCSHVPYSYVKYDEEKKKKITSGGGKSCFGFGNWCCWYTYSLILGDTDMDSRALFAEGKLEKSFLTKNVRAGDVIRINQHHTVVFYSMDDTGIWVLDANVKNEAIAKGQNLIQFRHIDFSSDSKAVVARPKTIIND